MVRKNKIAGNTTYGVVPLYSYTISSQMILREFFKKWHFTPQEWILFLRKYFWDFSACIFAHFYVMWVCTL